MTTAAEATAGLLTLLHDAQPAELHAAQWWLGRYVSEIDLAREGHYLPPPLAYVDGDPRTYPEEILTRRRALQLANAAIAYLLTHPPADLEALCPPTSSASPKT
jgi:hypothetical protein